MTTNLAVFNGLAAGNGNTYTASLSTSANTTTGVTTITMSASQLVDDSSYSGHGNNNNGALTITLSGNVGNATADASGSPTSFGTALTAPVALNGSYGSLASTVMATTGSGGYGMVGSTATILAGTNNLSGSSETVSMAWRTQTQAERTSPELVSDVLNLSGMGLNGSIGRTSTFALEMNYDPDLLPGGAGNELVLATDEMIQLDWLNPATGTWENAVLGNYDSSNDTFVGIGKWNNDMTLGDWGVDTTNHDVWAVVNHNSEFAVVPEPSTLVLLAAGALGVLGWGWQRRKGWKVLKDARRIPFLALFLMACLVVHASANTLTFTTSGTGEVTLPACAVTIQCWGAGGNGSGDVGINGELYSGGGGGNGGYSQWSGTLAAGNYMFQVGTAGGGQGTFPSTIGGADTIFEIPSLPVWATGGANGFENLGGAGGMDYADEYPSGADGGPGMAESPILATGGWGGGATGGSGGYSEYNYLTGSFTYYPPKNGGFPGGGGGGAGVSGLVIEGQQVSIPESGFGVGGGGELLITYNAVPEPSSITLLGSALLGFGVVYLRRRHGAKA